MVDLLCGCDVVRRVNVPLCIHPVACPLISDGGLGAVPATGAGGAKGALGQPRLSLSHLFRDRRRNHRRKHRVPQSGPLRA